MKTCVECKEKFQEEEGEFNSENKFLCFACAEELREEGDTTECPECGESCIDLKEDKVCPECGADVKAKSEAETEEATE